MRRKKVDYLWKTSCGAYLTAILIGVIWAAFGCRWDICLYAALVAVGIGMISILMVGLLEDYGNPFVEEEHDEGFQELICTLTSYVEELNKQASENKQ